VRLSTTNLIRHATLLIEPARESVYPRTTDKILFVLETVGLFPLLPCVDRDVDGVDDLADNCRDR
jgi:hypothetical protein